MDSSFINPWMLVALAGAAIPIIIEWLFRRRRRRIEFAAMRYLMNPKKRKRIRLQDRLLLILRTALLAVLAAALARPLLAPAMDGAREARQAVVILDATYSMGQAIGQTTAFATGQAMALEVLRGLPKNASAAFIVLERQPRVVKPWTDDRDSVRDAVQEAQVSDSAGRMADALDAAAGLIAAAPRRNVEVYLISDLQRSTWAPTPNDPRDAAGLLGESRLAAPLVGALHARSAPTSGAANLGAEWFILDTGAGNRSNACVTRFEPVEKAMAVGVECALEVDVEVKNAASDARFLLSLFVDQDRPKTPATAPAGSRKIETKEFSLADFAQGRLTATFRHTFLDPGEHLLRVMLEGDSLSVDNQRFYLASVPASVEVLVVDGRAAEAGAGPRLAAVRRLCDAIAPATPPGFDRLTLFAATVRPPGDVFRLNLGDYAVVVLADVGDLGDALIARLEQYVADGGRLLIFVGDSVDAYAYNKRLLKEGRGLLPCELSPATGARSTDTRPASTGPAPTTARSEGLLRLVYTTGADPPHPAVAHVRQALRGAPAPTIGRHMPLALLNAARRAAVPYGRAVAYLSNGQPAIAERSFGRGRVVLVNTTADDTWNFLGYTNELPVLMQELLRWLVGNPDAGVNLEQGQVFTQPVLLSGQHLLLRRPDYTRVRVEPRTAEEDRGSTSTRPTATVWHVAYDDTDRQGVYTFDATAEVLARRRFAVNLSADEGDLTPLDTAALRGAEPRLALWGPEKPVRRTVEALHSVTELAGPFIWGLFFGLALETFLAARFGRRRI